MSQSINWKETLPIAAVFIVLILSSIFSLYPQTDLTYEQKACILSGGHWLSFSGQIHEIGDREYVPRCDCGQGKSLDPIKLACRVNP